MGECTEWGRIAILGAIAEYRAVDEKEAELICERTTPQFQHANGSVVLAAVKVRPRPVLEDGLQMSAQVILIHIRSVRREEFVKTIMRKLAPPLGASAMPPFNVWLDDTHSHPCLC